MTVTFKIPKSSSKNYKTAMKIAEKFGVKDQIVSFTNDDFFRFRNDFLYLYHYIHKWKGFEMWFNGDYIVKHEHSRVMLTITDYCIDRTAHRMQKVERSCRREFKRIMEPPEEGTSEWADYMIQTHFEKLKYGEDYKFTINLSDKFKPNDGDSI